MSPAEVVYGNPLFSFMVFVQSNNFELEHITELYQSKPASELPTIVYFLDRGMILNANINWFHKPENNLGPLSPIPPLSAFVQFVINEVYRGKGGIYRTTDQDKEELEVLNRWIFTTFDADKSQMAANFGSFYFQLATHLDQCTLTSPDMREYLNHFFGSQSMTIVS